MSRVFASSVAAMTVVFAVNIVAQLGPVDPTEEFQEAMKSNTGISPVEGGGGTIARNFAVDTQNYEAIISDAAMLRENFAKMGEILTELKFMDALKWIGIGQVAINNIDRYAADAVWQYGGDESAMTSSRQEIERAKFALAEACRGCHIKHRVHVLESPVRFEIQP